MLFSKIHTYLAYFCIRSWRRRVFIFQIQCSDSVKYCTSKVFERNEQRLLKQHMDKVWLLYLFLRLMMALWNRKKRNWNKNNWLLSSYQYLLYKVDSLNFLCFLYAKVITLANNIVVKKIIKKMSNKKKDKKINFLSWQLFFETLNIKFFLKINRIFNVYSHLMRFEI